MSANYTKFTCAGYVLISCCITNMLGKVCQIRITHIQVKVPDFWGSTGFTAKKSVGDEFEGTKLFLDGSASDIRLGVLGAAAVGLLNGANVSFDSIGACKNSPKSSAT